MARPLTLIALGLVAAFAGASCAVTTEQPKYRVLRRYDDFEVRAYPALVVAETEVEATREEAGNLGFRRLAGYIFGKNQSEAKVAMTAPVTQAETSSSEKLPMTAPVTQIQGTGTSTGAAQSQWTIRFMMPARYRLETLPRPLDPSVRLRRVPARVMAAIRYSGRWTSERCEEHLERLLQALRREHLEADGPPEWARYDPPFTPWFLRTNEVLIPIASPR